MVGQLVTLEDAKDVAAKLVDIGGGVAPYKANDPETSGIYIPVYGGPFVVPEDGDKKFYLLRFVNGADGFNAGLVKIIIAMFPTRWPQMIAQEVNATLSFDDIEPVETRLLRLIVDGMIARDVSQAAKSADD